MRRTSKPATRTTISENDDSQIADELRRILVSAGRNERRGSQSHRCEVARANVRTGLNRCVETLMLLLRQNGEARAFAAALAAALAPDVQISGTEIELEIAEMRLHGSIAAFESEDLAGLISTPDRGELIRECYRESALVQEIARAEESILYRRLAS